MKIESDRRSISILIKTISGLTECHVTAFHTINVFKLNQYIIIHYYYNIILFKKFHLPEDVA